MRIILNLAKCLLVAAMLFAFTGCQKEPTPEPNAAAPSAQPAMPKANVPAQPAAPEVNVPAQPVMPEVNVPAQPAMPEGNAPAAE